MREGGRATEKHATHRGGERYRGERERERVRERERERERPGKHATQFGDRGREGGRQRQTERDLESMQHIVEGTDAISHAKDEHRLIIACE